MKRVICNECRKEGPLNRYGSVPDGWYNVSQQGKVWDDVHLCSTACLILHVRKLTEPAQEPARA